MADDTTRRDIQPDGVLPDAGSPFLPVTPGGWILCAFFFSVAVVALCHAANDVGAFRDALQHKDVSELVSSENGYSATGGGKIPDNEVVTVDGKEYYSFPGVSGDEEVREERNTNAELQDAARPFIDGYGEEFQNAGWSDRSVMAGIQAGIYKADGRAVYEEPGYCEKQGNIQPLLLHRGEPLGAEEPGIVAREKREIENRSFSKSCKMDGTSIDVRNSANPGDYYFSGVYRLGDNRDSEIFLAALPGSFLERFAASAIGRKLTQAMMVPLVSFAVQTGAMTVLDETLAKEAPAIESCMMEVMSEVTPAACETATALVTDGVVVTESRMSVAVADVLCSNAANGTAMTMEELAAESASRYAAVSGGSGNFEYMTEPFLEKLANGLIACDELPLLSQAGQNLLEMGGYSLADDLQPFPDAEGFTGSGGGNDPVGLSYDSELPTGRVSYTASGNQYSFDGITSIKVIYNQDGTWCVSRLAGSSIFSSSNASNITVGPNVTVYYFDDSEAYRTATKNNIAQSGYTSSFSNGDPTFGLEGFAGDFYDAGGQLVGNDALFGDNGELLDSGNADITAPIYSDNYNPDNWNQVLYDAGVNAVQPAENTSFADNEVIAGNKTGETIYDAVNANKTSPPPKTIPQLQFMVDGSMGDLQSAVSDKFPFSVPFNISKVVNGLVATPEAPHFTWVFAVPTGNVEYEVDLSPFSPVAHVLRVMLDVLLVFSVVSLLGKIAQVWGFFDKSAD